MRANIVHIFQSHGDSGSKNSSLEEGTMSNGEARDWTFKIPIPALASVSRVQQLIISRGFDGEVVYIMMDSASRPHLCCDHDGEAGPILEQALEHRSIMNT